MSSRARDRKVWNEDLVRALKSRCEMAIRQEKRDQFLWRDGAKQIEAVRKNIYTFSTGRVVNLPQNLKKRVFELCMDIIQGRKPVLPDGYAQVMTSNPQQQQGNPFERHPYLKTIKARSGAYAILLAFHNSTIKTLSKDEICAKAQPFCDTDMEANFHAGRMHGAWSSNKTLVKHGFINQTAGGAQHIDGVGFRGQTHYYTLTRDGEQFIECVIRKFPQDSAGGAARTAAPAANNAGQRLNGASIKRSPFSTPNRAARAPTAANKASRKHELAQGDGEKLLNWIMTTAQVGDTMDFKVGKARRKQLHDACDALEQDLPGLKLQHSSAFETDTSNRRVLSVRVIQRPHGNVAKQEPSAKRSLFGGGAHSASSDSRATLEALGGSPAKRSRSNVPASVAAAQAALQRQAIYESTMLESDGKQPAVLNIDDSDDDEEINRAIELSRTAASKPNEFATTKDDSFEDDELKRAIELSQQSSKPTALTETDGFDAKEVKRAMDLSQQKLSRKQGSKANGAAPVPRKFATSNSSYSSDSDDDDLLNCGPTFGTCTQKPPAKAAKNPPAKRALFRQEPDNELIELLSDEEDTPVKSKHKESTILDSGPGSRRTETISSVARQDSKRPAIAQQEVIDIDDDESEDDDSIIEILEDSQDCIATTALPPPRDSGILNDHQLTVLIDNRERNRNHTPRHLRMELTRLVKEGALKSVWPRNIPAGNVEESGLAFGDFAYEIQPTAAAGRKRLPVAVERKRVSDLVSRSAAGDHWKQFMLMRDNCMHSIFLIETDTRSAVRFTAFGAQELDEWNPTCTLIDNERAIFLFFGRALLSSQAANFIQTRDETSSLRSVAALGVMAMASSELRSKAAKACPPARSCSTRLVDRLTGGGIPWKLARAISDSVGSIQHLEFLYKECQSDACRSQLLTPFIMESEYDGQSNTVADWSNKIFRVFHTSFTQDPSLSATRKGSGRRVTIELPESMSNLFTAATDDSFYTLKLGQDNLLGLALPTVSMQTSAGKFKSHRLFVHLLQAKSLVSLITGRIHECHGEYVRVAKEVASVINGQCHHQTMVSGKDRRVLLLCGLNPAIDAAAKQAGYRIETRVVVDLVLAELMLSQNLCVIQAIRLKGDTELLLQLLSLACFHYHLLFQANDGL